MPKRKQEKPKETEVVEGISRTQHNVLNNLSMVMFWIRKKKLTEDQLSNILHWSNEGLQEIKAL